MDGILNILKPPGITSFGVVAYIRRLFKEKKVGHTGTLDPGVAGVLPLGLGKGTKVTHFLLDSDKAYRGEITFGMATDTQDAYGRVLDTREAAFITPQLVIQAFEQFIGDQGQIPPMTSAVRYEGKKLYELARKGIEITREPRQVKIHSLEMVKFTHGSSHPKALFDVTCSKGTYIRTLCHDIGQYLGCGAYMSFLVRTRSGPFDLAGTKTLEELKIIVEQGKAEEALLPIDAAIPGFHQVTVSHEQEIAILHGNQIIVPLNCRSEWDLTMGEWVRLSDFTGALLAIAEIKEIKEESCRIQPIRVLR